MSETQLHDFLILCGHDLHTAVSASSTCPGKDTCSCEVDFFASFACADAPVRHHSSNANASSILGGLAHQDLDLEVPAIPADGVFLYTLEYSIRDDSEREMLLSGQWDLDVAMTLQQYLNMPDVEVSVLPKQQNGELLRIALAVTPPKTATMLDILSMNRLLSSADATEHFSVVLSATDLKGSRSTTEESGYTIAQDAILRTESQGPSSTKLLSLYVLMGAVVGCVVGILSMYAMQRRERKWRDLQSLGMAPNLTRFVARNE